MFFDNLYSQNINKGNTRPQRRQINKDYLNVFISALKIFRPHYIKITK